MDRIQNDLNWLSANKVDYVWITDANFGQFDRDDQIADWIIDKKRQSGHPCSVRANYAKSNNKHVFELAKRFSESDLSKSTTISLQSLSDEALRNVGRHNMHIEHFSALMSLYRTAGIPTYSEMILALPGETFKSFVEGIGKLLDAGQHSMIEVYDCVMLPNSVLAQKEYIKKHGISTVRLEFFQYHSEAATDDITEYADIVISTNTLSAEDWVECKLFSFAVQSLHCMGLLRAVAVYLHNERQVEYTAFYTRLVQWFLDNPETLGGFFFSDIREQLYKMISERHSPQYYDIDFGDVRWPLDEGAFLFFTKDLQRFLRGIL
jgi:putative methyltransferase